MPFCPLKRASCLPIFLFVFLASPGFARSPVASGPEGADDAYPYPVYLPLVVGGSTTRIVGLVAANDSPTLLGSATTLTATVESGSGVRYVWDPGDDSPPIESGAVVTHTYPAVGTYTAMVTASNVLGSAWATTTVVVIADQSPLELSGLTPLWEESFTDGRLDRIQYCWAMGDHSALSSFVIPGAVYLGNEGGRVEQQINNFKSYDGEPLPNTIEFDLLNPIGGGARISLRPWRRRDFAHIYVGGTGNQTRVSFTFIDSGPAIYYAEPTGPALGWAHVTVSYQQVVSDGTVYAHYVVAINQEVHEYSAPSGITNPDWLTQWNSRADADGWSIEYDSSIATMGRYVTNVKAYHGFLSRTDMESRLQGRVVGYLANLPDPRAYGGPAKAFQVHKDLELYGPNAMAYAEQIGPLTVRFDGSLSSSVAKIASYEWTFGDGSTASGRVVDHTYARPGTYQAGLVVSNQYGTESHRITVVVKT